MKNIIYILAPIGITALIIGFIAQKNDKIKTGSLDDFARCLASKKIVMYGADWCSHCQNEKNAFGDSFKFVPYIECTDDPQKCLAASITGYPTWIFPNGEKLTGEQGINRLSQKSGCLIEK